MLYERCQRNGFTYWVRDGQCSYVELAWLDDEICWVMEG